MQNTYWNKQGAYQADFDRMCDQLIPMMGNCETVAGEMLRAANRLAYDLYNNGMGNNTSGAVNFLKAKGVIDTATHDTIYEYTRGLLYDGRYEGDSLQVAVERMVDRTVEHILQNPELLVTENTEDMFDYEDDWQHFCEECGDETDGGGLYSSLCSYCEDEQLAEDEEEEEYLY